MELTTHKFLHDITISIDRINTYIGSVKHTDHVDTKTQDAVERRLGIIGQAMWRANQIDTSLAISNKQEILALKPELELKNSALTWNGAHTFCMKYLQELKKEIDLILEAD